MCLEGEKRAVRVAARKWIEQQRDALFPRGMGNRGAGLVLHTLRSLQTYLLGIVEAVCGERPPASSPTLEALEAEIKAEGVGKAIPLGRFEEMARRIVEETMEET